MEELITKIKIWVVERNLHEQDSRVQLCKTMEELGELASATFKNQRAAKMDGVGDIVVTLICYCLQEKLDFEACINMAYEQIKDRKGKLIDGVFVKESDL